MDAKTKAVLNRKEEAPNTRPLKFDVSGLMVCVDANNDGRDVLTLNVPVYTPRAPLFDSLSLMELKAQLNVTDANVDTAFEDFVATLESIALSKMLQGRRIR